MKRGTFRKKTLEEVKEAQSIKYSLKTPKKGKISRHKRSKKLKVHWKPPAWFMAIPTGSHGSNPIQKRLWKLTSDFVRIFDFEKYGVCASCGKKIENWKDGDCGHYKAWSVCNNYFKYNKMNLALQCSNCNRLSDGNTGYKFAETLKNRFGNTILDDIEKVNSIYHGGKFENILLVEMSKNILMDFEMETTIKPDYYEKVTEKIAEQTLI